jgi:hypothetical protein
MPRHGNAIALLVLGGALVACGGGGSSTAPTAAPAPVQPSKAAVRLNIDPNPQYAEYQGDGWYKFKVNLEFLEDAGVGARFDQMRVQVKSALTGAVLVDWTYLGVQLPSQRIESRGRVVFQFTSPTYHMELGTRSADLVFTTSMTDDKGNPVSLSNTARVLSSGAVPVD